MNFDMNKSVGFLLNKTSLLSKHHFNKLIKSYGISPEQWSIIYRVVENKGITSKEVANSTYKDQGNLTRMVDKLVKSEFLIREFDENDRRIVKLYPTDKSIKLVKKIVPLSKLHNEKLTNGFSEDEYEKLLEFLNRIYKNLEKG